MKILRWVSLVLLLCVCACHGERASASDCETIFNRLVLLELQEMGFRDPALVALRQQELRERHREQLQACTGRRIPVGALACVADAETAEGVSHECLR